MSTSRRALLEQQVRTYFEGCNESNETKIRSTFADSVVHYFPPGIGGPYVGGTAIAHLWISMVARFGSRWTIDALVSDDEHVVIEWSHFQPTRNWHIRGAEWYDFDFEGRITVIKAYYASPRDLSIINELEGYPYRERGYAMGAPDRT